MTIFSLASKDIEKCVCVYVCVHMQINTNIVITRSEVLVVCTPSWAGLPAHLTETFHFMLKTSRELETHLWIDSFIEGVG